MAIDAEFLAELQRTSMRKSDPKTMLITTSEYVAMHVEMGVADLEIEALIAAEEGESRAVGLFVATSAEEIERTRGLRDAVADRFNSIGLLSRCFDTDDREGLVRPDNLVSYPAAATLWLFGVEISWDTPLIEQSAVV